MVVAYAGLSLLCASISVLLLWSVSPGLAIFSAPFFASAGVLLAGVYVALRRSRPQVSVGALPVDEADQVERRAAA
jgi:hypothetical protein